MTLLNHPPSEIIQQLLLDLGHGSSVSSGSSWPVYANNLPDSPDNAICVYDTESILQGRLMDNGRYVERFGFQVTVRSGSVVDGYVKCNQIVHDFDEYVYDCSVVMDDEEDVYSLHAISRTSGVVRVGPEIGVARRYLYTINATILIYLLDEETGTGTAS